MGKFTKKDKRTELEKERDNAVLLLKTYLPGSDEYKEQLSVVERLNAMVVTEKGTKKSVSPDTLVNCATGAIQVAAILNKEKLYNITSKAMNFVKKAR